MLFSKLKLIAGLFLAVALALGAGGQIYQSVGAQDVSGAKGAAKPRSELEALRRENELLKLNLEVVLEKVKAQEAELRALKEKAKSEHEKTSIRLHYEMVPGTSVTRYAGDFRVRLVDPLDAVEAALKTLRQSTDKDAKKRAADTLEQAAKKLRKQVE